MPKYQYTLTEQGSHRIIVFFCFFFFFLIYTVFKSDSEKKLWEELGWEPQDDTTMGSPLCVNKKVHSNADVLGNVRVMWERTVKLSLIIYLSYFSVCNVLWNRTFYPARLRLRFSYKTMWSATYKKLPVYMNATRQWCIHRDDSQCMFSEMILVHSVVM